MENNHNWSTLLNKYLNNTITPEEQAELDRQIANSPLKARQFKEHTDPGELMKQLKEMYYIDSEASWRDLQKKLPFLDYKT